MIKESAPTGGPRKIAGSFAKKKESDVGFVANSYSRARQQHVAAIMPTTNATTYHQPRFQQQPQQFQPQQYRQQPPPQQRQQINRPPPRQQTPFAQQQRFQRFDPIPMKFGDLLPSLLERNLVQLKAPPATPITPPWWYKPEARCAFHQGEPGHDVENCYALKVEVQKIINNGILSF